MRFFILFFFILISTKSICASENLYWSNSKTGPLSVEDAKKQFGKRPLKSIEGIYTGNTLGTVFIIEDPSDQKIFKMFIIDLNKSDNENNLYNGTWEATFIADGSPWSFFIRMWYHGAKTYYRTESGKAAFGQGVLNLIYDNLSREKTIMRKVWPTDLYNYNSQFESKEKKSEKPFNVYSDYGIEDEKSYLDYWWALILIAAVIFFIHTQTGKEIKIKKGNKGKFNKNDFINKIIRSLALKDEEPNKDKSKKSSKDKKKDFKDYLG